MNIATQIRDINELNGLVQVLLNRALKEIRNAGINPLIVETYRSQERQNYLYCLGRTVAEVVAKGISKAFAEKYCNLKAAKRTWTLSSEHRSCKAVDVVPQRKVNGTMTAIWDANDKETKKIIQVMEKYGFEAGANWKTNPDSPHFQVKASFSNIFTRKNTNSFVTKMVQRLLRISVDGIWGDKTDAAVSEFRRKQGYLSYKPMLGAAALKQLIK